MQYVYNYCANTKCNFVCLFSAESSKVHYHDAIVSAVIKYV